MYAYDRTIEAQMHVDAQGGGGGAYISGSFLKLKNAKKLIKNSHFGHVKIAL